MAKAVPTQHAGVVLRSHDRQLRALLAIAAIAVVGLTAAVVILAADDGFEAGAGSVTHVSAPGPTGDTRYDGGPEEGSRRVVATQPPSTRYDGGPEEGTAAVARPATPATSATTISPAVRYDGGPEEGRSLAPSQQSITR
jgi:hypothetical protein